MTLFRPVIVVFHAVDCQIAPVNHKGYRSRGLHRPPEGFVGCRAGRCPETVQISFFCGILPFPLTNCYERWAPVVTGGVLVVGFEPLNASAS